ncbi:gastrula zinc finger protein XlCGF57.1-like [Ptychodera flava]|uniref:gastrula zinc finger protein XlCGF57.1-like n=1 Tax=Ptychodera flava TaxID=63121 RepID=UPI00396A547D
MEQMNNNMKDNKSSEETDNMPDSDFAVLKTNAEHFMEELQGDVSDSNTAATKALAVTSQPTETKEVLHSDTEGNSSSDADSSYHPKTESDCNKHYTPRTRKSNRPRAASDKALGVASYYREMENDSDEEYTRQTRKSNRRRASSDKALGDTSYYPETENDSYDEYTPQTRKSNWQRATSGKALKTRKKRKEKFQCEDCGKSLRMEKRYSLHMEWHKNKGHKKRRQKPNVRDNQCCICGTQYTTMTTLKAHLRSKHPGEKSYTCEICGASFVTDESKYKHITEIHGDSMLQCDQCDMAFRSSGALGQHKMTKHIPLELWNHHCDVCSRFPYKSVLQTHMKSHSDERNFYCQVCGKDFKKKDHYVRHVKNHEGEKPYMCEHCGKNFGRKEHLMQHSVVHTKEKNFLCDYCGKSFSNKANLYVHRRQHTGVRPVVCKICGQGFHRQRGLAKHMEKIHPNPMTQSNDIGTHDNATTDAVSQIS